jgi:hypothetical protein
MPEVFSDAASYVCYDILCSGVLNEFLDGSMHYLQPVMATSSYDGPQSRRMRKILQCTTGWRTLFQFKG